MKRFVMRFIASLNTLMVLSFTLMPSALAMYVEDEEDLNTSRTSHLETVVPAYMDGCYDSNTSSLSISNSFDLYDFATGDAIDSDMYFVFVDDIIVAMLTIGEFNGQYYSSFEQNDSSEESNDVFTTLQMYYVNDQKIVVGNYNDFFAVYDGESITIANNADIADVDISTKLAHIENEKTFTTQDIFSTTSSSLYYLQLDTARVANDEADDGDGFMLGCFDWN